MFLGIFHFQCLSFILVEIELVKAGIRAAKILVDPREVVNKSFRLLLYLLKFLEKNHQT